MRLTFERLGCLLSVHIRLCSAVACWSDRLKVLSLSFRLDHTLESLKLVGLFRLQLVLSIKSHLKYTLLLGALRLKAIAIQDLGNLMSPDLLGELLGLL